MYCSLFNNSKVFKMSVYTFYKSFTLLSIFVTLLYSLYLWKSFPKFYNDIVLFPTAIQFGEISLFEISNNLNLPFIILSSLLAINTNGVFKRYKINNLMPLVVFSNDYSYEYSGYFVFTFLLVLLIIYTANYLRKVLILLFICLLMCLPFETPNTSGNQEENSSLLRKDKETIAKQILPVVVATTAGALAVKQPNRFPRLAAYSERSFDRALGRVIKLDDAITRRYGQRVATAGRQFDVRSAMYKWPTVQAGCTRFAFGASIGYTGSSLAISHYESIKQSHKVIRDTHADIIETIKKDNDKKQ